MPAAWDGTVGPWKVTVTYRYRRPKSHYGTNGSLRPTAASEYKTTIPDVDKLVRATLDALTDAGVWRDDSQVVELVARKLWHDSGDCCVIDVERPVAFVSDPAATLFL